MTTQPDLVARFHQLHDTGCFVMPNPWDIGSALALADIGFPALATSSAGSAWTMGRADNQLGLEQALQHLRDIASAVTLPVNADFEGGFADEPEALAANVKLAVETGIAGLSIEDSNGNDNEPLYDFDLSVERIRAARQAIDETGTGVLLTGRSEGFVVGRPDLDETIRRISAYSEAGADCLYAPLIQTMEQIEAVVAAAGGKPVNLLIGTPFITVAQAASLGVRRISVGGALAKSAWAGFLQTAQEIAEKGTFSGFRGLPDIDGLFTIP